MDKTQAKKYILAYLEDIMVLFPDYSNNVNIGIHCHTIFFLFPSTYRSYVYTVLLSIMYDALFLKKKSVYLNKNTLLLKDANHHLSLQQVIFWLVEDLCLDS